MKNTKPLLFVCLLVLSLLSHAQEPVTLNVTYVFSYVRDLTDRGNPYKANMILSLGAQSSRYCPESTYNDMDPRAIRERQKQEKQQGVPSGPTIAVAGGPTLWTNNQGALINEEITRRSGESKISINAKIAFKSYFVETPNPDFNWAIQTEKKTIGNYTCQKAIGRYGGRTYIAWFAPDLPTQTGPWKLGGLPGLILEAKDSSNEISFSFKDMSRNTDPEETTASFLHSDRSIATNMRSYQRLKQEYESDPEAVMAALAPNARVHIQNVDASGSQVVRKIKQYNPMELH